MARKSEKIWERAESNPLEIEVIKKEVYLICDKDGDNYDIESCDEEGEIIEEQLPINSVEGLPHPIWTGTGFYKVLYKENGEEKVGAWPFEIYYDENLQKEFFEDIREKIKDHPNFIKKTLKEMEENAKEDGSQRAMDFYKEFEKKQLSKEYNIESKLKELEEIENGDEKTKIRVIHQRIHLIDNYFIDPGGGISVFKE